MFGININLEGIFNNILAFFLLLGILGLVVLITNNTQGPSNQQPANLTTNQTINLNETLLGKNSTQQAQGWVQSFVCQHIGVFC